MTEQPSDRPPASFGSDEPSSADFRAGRVAELYARHGHPRTRVVDDHMFQVGGGVWYPSTFRLQLFTAPGAQPVAVVVQAKNEGMSLTNGREEYLAEIWRRHCPSEPRPPLWIQRQLLRGGDEFSLCELQPDTRPDAGPYAVSLSGGRRYRVTLEQIHALVGTDISSDRGEGYVPRPPEPAVRLKFTVEWVALLPRPKPFREPDCMPTGTSRIRRVARQIVHRRRSAGCCWYHQGDWGAVSRAAITLLRSANREGIDHDDLYDYFQQQADKQRCTGWNRDALLTLACPGDAIQLEREGLRRTYINGQHRAQAMLDAGVPRTITARLIYPDLVRDLDWPQNAPTAAEQGLPEPFDRDN